MSASKLVEEINGLSTDERSEVLLEVFKGFNLMEVKGFVDTWCKTFDVEASAPMGGMMMAAAPAEEAAAEPTEFDVVLTGIGEKKIQVIKAVRAITALGLKEAKELVESAPKAVKEKLSKDEAEKIKGELEAAGASVEVKGVS